MKPITLIAAIILFPQLGPVGALAGETPKGWFPAGSHPKDYEMSTDRDMRHDGKASATLKSIVPKTGGFGTLMQTVKADSFRGKRIRMSGYAKAKEVTDWAGFWLRVDASKGDSLAFDNMQDRAIKGTVDWKKYEIVLDVPEESQAIAFGLLLSGPGQVWMDDLKFEVVGKEVPTTGSPPKDRVPATPANLDFEASC